MHCHTNCHAHKRIIWSKLYNNNHHEDYNKTRGELLEDCEITNHSTFIEAISRAADDTLVNKERTHLDWFNLSKPILLKALTTCDKAMQEYTQAKNEL